MQCGDRVVSPEAFERLLAAFDPVRDGAGEGYEVIRACLLRFFGARRFARPEELADETIDRVCRRLGQGEVIRTPEVRRYFIGVARNVARETWDLERRRRESGFALEVARRARLAPLPEDEKLACLDHCLEALEPESRELLLRYYDSGPSQKIARRRALAHQLGVPPNTLRTRLHRLRTQLETRIRRCRYHAEARR